MPDKEKRGSVRIRILLVDDEVGFVDVVSKRLSKRNIDVTQALSGTEGIQALRGQDFDVAVLDLKMEDMDGIEVLRIFKKMVPEMPVIILDHVVPAANEKTATNHVITRQFVATHKISNFYDVGTGICHQVLMEKGLALPGKIIVGSDSHTCSYGALGVFSTGIDRTEAAALLLKGNMRIYVKSAGNLMLKHCLRVAYENQVIDFA